MNWQYGLIMPFMPKKATRKSSAAALAERQINAYCESTDTPILRLSSRAGVSQAALWRFLRGERKTVTPTARKVLVYIDKQHNQHNAAPNFNAEYEYATGYRLIESAILSLWDGTHRSAELLAALIKALKPALDVASQAASEAPKGEENDDK